jgi:colanic acid biosynthesis glycosyl transferase WcaI
MNILFLSHYFPPEVNAPATRTYEHCKRWVEAGHSVTVITCEPNCPDGVLYKGYKNRWRWIEKSDGINVIRIWTYLAPNKGFLKRIANYVSYMICAVIQSLSLRDIDVVIATSPQFFCGWAGVLCKWTKGWPFVLEIRDIWPESIIAVGAMKKSAFIRFLEFLEKKMYAAADHIITVGEGYRRNIISKGRGPASVSVVVNGVDLEYFSPTDIRDLVRKEQGTGNRFVCSYIGTVGMAHGLEVILEAASLYKQNNDPSVVFWIVGDGAERRRLQQEADNRGLKAFIIFTGRLPKEKMPGIIAASDACLVHLHGTELFSTVIPSKIFELCAMNVPIIMGVRGEALEIVQRAQAGVPMEPDNAHSLVECIDIIKTQGRSAFKGREFVAEHYNRDIQAQKMLEIIARIAKIHLPITPGIES